MMDFFGGTFGFGKLQSQCHEAFTTVFNDVQGPWEAWGDKKSRPVKGGSKEGNDDAQGA